jgi:hypothetical protein
VERSIDALVKKALARIESDPTRHLMPISSQVGQRGPWKLPTALQHALRDRLIRAGAEVMEDAVTQRRMRLRLGSGKAAITLYRTGTCTVDGNASAIDTAAQMVLRTILESTKRSFLISTPSRA